MRGPDTIFALSSGRPPAAVAVIRISGEFAHQAAAAVAGSLPAPRIASLRKLRHPTSGELLDEALVLRFDAPATATGEDVVEFHCHGGRAVADAILTTLSQTNGLRMAEPGEFTRRAFENGKIDLTEAEGLADLLEAETEAQRKAALALAEGGLRQQIAKWQDRLLALSAGAERAIDYDEEDESIDPELIAGCESLASELDEWLERPMVEPLKDGLLVVIAGPPNSGKSSLLNAIVGQERSIVTDLPGTTRDHVEAAISIEGVPLRLTDTAGLRHTEDEVEAIGVGRARNLAGASDILIWLGHPNDAPAHAQKILVSSKADLVSTMPDSPNVLKVSARNGQGIGDLLRTIRQLALDMLPGPNAVTLNRRQSRCLRRVSRALSQAALTRDTLILAEELRSARAGFDELTGRTGINAVLDFLFSRFCLGK